MPDRSIRDFVAVYLRPHRPRLALLAVLFLVGVGLQLANPQLAKTFIDEASSGAPFDRLVRIAAVFLAVALLTQVATVAEVYVAEDLGWRTTNALRIDLTTHVLALDDGFHADHGAGELLERIDGDVAAIAGFFARFVVHVLGSALFLLGVLVLLWREDWRIGGLLTVVALASVTYLTRGGAFVGRRSRASRVVNADLSAYLEERLSALVDVKANGADDATMRGLHERLSDRFRVDRDALLAASLFSSAASTALVSATVVSLATAAWLQQQGTMTLGGVYLVFRYTGMLRMPLERLTRHMNSFQRAMGGIVRVRELLATEPRIADGRGDALPPGALAVELDHVHFSYDREPVLRDVSFRVERGHVLGIVGRTGSGKTTLTRLLFRLYDVDRGVVRIGGVDVRDLRVDDLRGRIGLVTQDVQLFAGTLRDNVRLFDPDVGDDRLVAVFESLDLLEWLAELPDGLDTVLGPTARGLSAGEAQLVALARVFLEDPGLVVLDEASSRLDPHTETLLEHAIDRLLGGRTAIVIAHRLRTIERVDEVLVLDGGRVVEHGDRAALVGDAGSRFAGLLRTGLPEVRA
ncbi:MAG TPA: ABC transporter ATP-binding protein [Acidimicrobiales bacterium]|nr:ABC transporter ATP-binding protein [Acidimicrobiales bacterium]